jgi:2'-hydroxyisoflavone reductase
MNILIIGGTVFLGRHIVDAALARGHTITLFNRGQRNPELFPDVEKLRGDRNEPLDLLNALRGRTFDAVIDVCGYKPEQIQRMVEALGDEVRHYVFISSISAYGDRPPQISYDEQAPLAQGNEGYGEEKARSEEAIAAAYPQRTAIVRPGLIVGPHDPTGRFVYWPMRIARGGDVLAPGRADCPTQWLDVRDLAEWIVHLVEQRIVGAFNAVTPGGANTMQHFLNTCIRVTKSSARLQWRSDKELLDANVAPWTELPVWIPEDDPESGGLMLASSAHAVNNGLRFRSIDDTVAAVYAWATSLDPNDERLGAQRTLSSQREQTILA